MTKNTITEPRLPKDRKNHPVTMGVFEEHRQEMKAFETRVDARFEAVDKRFDEVDKRFDQVDKRFDAMDKRFDAMDKRFDAMDKRFDKLEAMLIANLAEMKQLHHESMMRIEQQKHENDLMMESQNGLFARQKRVEERVDGFDETLKSLRTPRRPKSQ